MSTCAVSACGAVQRERFEGIPQSCRLLREGKRMRFAFIHAMVAKKAPFHVAGMCRTLEVTRQGYYAYARSLASPRLAEEAALRDRIIATHAASERRLGSPMIRRHL